MMVIGALVNHDRGCFEECESTRIILFESGIHPWIKHLEDVRHGLRQDDDAVKCAIAERAGKMKMLDARYKSNSIVRSLSNVFECMINGKSTDHILDEPENNLTYGEEFD